MRLDHVSYVASHDQISDVVNRIGSQIGTAFVDGGIHPKFGTRNFTAPLLNGQYVEVVCPMDHPATDLTPFGKAVKNKALEGGGWLSWVLSTSHINKIENKLGRSSVLGNRKKPDGSELNWKQIGVMDSSHNLQLPFFVEWISNNHPSVDGLAKSKLNKISIVGSKETISEWVGGSTNLESVKDFIAYLGVDKDEGQLGIKSVEFEVNKNFVVIT
jgi:hypothetical protein